jgi:hypothetical protein
MGNDKEPSLPAELIAQEAQLLHRMPARPAGRDAELGREVARLNKAVAEAAEELTFDDQPVDFLALLVELREKDSA